MIHHPASPSTSAPPSPRTPVLADVAARAGVSHQTVSRVVNGHPNVAPGTRARVQLAIDELGYRPNTAARALVKGRSQRIGVVTTDSSHYGPAATLRGVEEAARAAGFAVSVTILPPEDEAGITSSLEQLHSQGVEGIVVIAPQAAALDVLSGFSARVPLVEAASIEEAGGADAAVQVRGAWLATRHLLDLGHVTVHHVAGPPDWRETRSRIEGWRSALQEARAVAGELSSGDWSPRSGYAAGRRLLERRHDEPGVSAVFVANDQMAIGLIRAFTEAGVDVPAQVSVVGFDDLPETAFLNPPMTTVHLDATDRGRRCVTELLARIAGNAEVRLPEPASAELVVRASTAAPGRGLVRRQGA